MKRLFSVEEQTIEDPATKLRLEFSSVHTDEVNEGHEPPSNDDTVILRLWTSDRTRLATYKLERNGWFISADVAHMEAKPADEEAPAPHVEAPATGQDSGTQRQGLVKPASFT